MVDAPEAGSALERIRAFLALDLDAASLRRVARVADRLRMASGAPSATWVPPGRMHVTLKFMGDLPTATVAPLSDALRLLMDRRPAPKATPFCLDAFPKVEQAHVIVVELLDPSGELSELAREVDRAAHDHGLAREQRAFRPHVTIARLKRPYDSRRWLRPDLAGASGECAVTALTLFRSDLAQAGPTHTSLAHFDFV
jgi:2'-5' RNA ligase